MKKLKSRLYEIIQDRDKTDKAYELFIDEIREAFKETETADIEVRNGYSLGYVQNGRDRKQLVRYYLKNLK